jgi:dienelactone hydrolase
MAIPSSIGKTSELSKRRSLVLAVLAFALAACASTPAGNAPAEEQVQLGRVWMNTLVVFPQAPNLMYRGNNFGDGVATVKADQPLPAVVFMHGCAGLHLNWPEVQRMVKGFARAGFVVFAPDSLARPHAAYCDAKNLRATTDRTAMLNRLAEIRSTVDRIHAFKWVDKDNLFLAGASMGGYATALYEGPEFRARVIFGSHCGAARGMPGGVRAPDGVAVLAIRGGEDEWFSAPHVKGRHCGEFPSMQKPNRQSVVLAGVPHDTSVDPKTMPMAIDFLRKYATRPIEPQR